MIKNTDLAYAAGYFDGDGCFSIGKVNCIAEKRIRYRDLIVINSTEIENLQWFQNKFGGTLRCQKHIEPSHKIIHRYVIKGNKIELFKKIIPFLVEKIDEFKVFEQFIGSNTREKRDNLIKEMSELKNFSNLIPKSIKIEIESIRNTIIPSEEDFSYLAGFIDAECCLNIQKSRHKERTNPLYKIQLQCNNSKAPCFYWLSARFGGQFHFIDRSKFKTLHRNQMSWRLSASSLSKILPKILPYLIHKKPVCELLIEFYKTTIKSGHVSPNSPLFQEYYRPIRELRDNIFHKIQFLNKKGI